MAESAGRRGGPGAGAGLEEMLELVELLSEEIGPRRPTSAAERLAAEAVADRLRDAGIEVGLEAFEGYSTFAAPAAPLLVLALAGVAAPRSRPLLRALPAALAGALMGLEEGLRHRPVSRLLSRRPSVNLLASVPSREAAKRTVCLVSHLDSSRSGWMFHPRFLPHLRRLLAAGSAALPVTALEPLLARRRLGRGLTAASRGVLLACLGMLIERELRGEDVPGANDNASGVALGATLLAEAAERPFDGTRVVMLATGCEEAGMLGVQRFAQMHPEASDWLFLNLDGVAAPARLRYLRREGIVRKWAADERLVGVCAELAERRPGLGLEPSDADAGLTYDATPLLARGMRAITLVACNRTIPNYHWPTDTAANLDRDVAGRALEVGRQLLAAIDRGDAD